MKFLTQIPAHARKFRSGLTYLSVVILTFIAPQIAWAQEEAEEPQAKWLLAYCLVALLIGLSIYSMCRPSTRRKKSQS